MSLYVWVFGMIHLRFEIQSSCVLKWYWIGCEQWQSAVWCGKVCIPALCLVSPIRWRKLTLMCLVMSSGSIQIILRHTFQLSSGIFFCSIWGKLFQRYLLVEKLVLKFYTRNMERKIPSVLTFAYDLLSKICFIVYSLCYSTC